MDNPNIKFPSIASLSFTERFKQINWKSLISIDFNSELIFEDLNSQNERILYLEKMVKKLIIENSNLKKIKKKYQQCLKSQ